MPKTKDRPVIEAALESGEVVTDLLMHDTVLAEVPVIGTAIKICKAADAVRDRAFAIKLSRFVQNLMDISEDQKQRLRKKIATSPEEAQKVGETLLFVIERLTDLDKPLLLSQVFLAYVDGVVSSYDLRRLCQAVDTAFADDLKMLLSLSELPEKSEEGWMQYLVASGLTRIIAGQTMDEGGKLYYEATDLADMLRTAYFHGRP